MLTVPCVCVCVYVSRREGVTLALASAPESLDVKVWDKADGSGGDELIGNHTKDLRSERDDKKRRLGESDSWSQSAQWLDLKDAKGKPAGRVQVSLEWRSTKPAGADDDRDRLRRGSADRRDEDEDEEEDGRGARGADREESQKDYESMRPFQLKDECAKRGLSRDGGREELIQRLQDDDADGDGADAGGRGERERERAGEPPAEDWEEDERGGVEYVPTEGAVSGSITLEAELPAAAKRAAFSQSIVKDLAEKMGVDPSRIRITSLDMVEVEVGKRGTGRRARGELAPGGVWEDADADSPADDEDRKSQDPQQSHDSGGRKYPRDDLTDQSVAQLRRMCEDEDSIEQRDIDDADEARDRKQAFTDLLLAVQEAGGQDVKKTSERGGSRDSKEPSKSSSRGGRDDKKEPEPEAEPEPEKQSGRSSKSEPSPKKKKKKK